MNSTVLKILKTIASVSVAFISFTIIVIIAFYFYLSDGVEFNLNKSNQTLSSLTNRFELDFSKNSSIYFKAREENIDTYITLENAIIKRSGKILINRPGKARIEYNEIPLLLISDGKKFVTINKKIKSITYYNLVDIPVNLLLYKNFKKVFSRNITT